MIDKLTCVNTKAYWVGPTPDKTNKIALLIPQYNEGLNKGFSERLDYFRQISIEFRSEIDVIIIDDGSTDNSLTRLIEFNNKYEETFHIVSVKPNGNKVGALYVTALDITHELVILSDFDTDLVGLDNIAVKTDFLQKDSSLMGGHFRMLPFEGEGKIFHFQQLEYTLARILYKFHNNGKSVPVMPGAGSCYKRDVLISIYDNHSGLRSGEDREATLIGLKLGYSTFYMENILALTRPPLSFTALVRQRIRWNLGYLETFNKEKKYYLKEIWRMNPTGLRTLGDISVVLYTILFPFLLLVVGLQNIKYLIALGALVYFSWIFWCFLLIWNSSKESREIRVKLFSSVLWYPVIKLSVDYLAWNAALAKFFTNKNRFV